MADQPEPHRCTIKISIDGDHPANDVHVTNLDALVQLVAYFADSTGGAA